MGAASAAVVVWGASSVLIKQVAGLNIFSKSARQELTALEYLTGMAIVAAIAILPIPLLFAGTLGTTDANGWLTIVYITVVNGLLGHFLMTWAHGHVALLTLSAQGRHRQRRLAAFASTPRGGRPGRCP